jgi:hypothetical protein
VVVEDATGKFIEILEREPRRLAANRGISSRPSARRT